MDDVTLRSLGLDPAVIGHGLDVDSTNTSCRFTDVVVDSADGWGFTGDPATSTMRGCAFTACTLGTINSTTLLNLATSGLSTYIEGRDGRVEDRASRRYDLAVGSTDVATVLAGSAYSSFEVEVRVVGRNAAGPAFARYVRYVRPENGAPQYVTTPADVSQGGITVAFAASGTTGVKVTTSATSASFVTVHVTARAGGGAATGNARSVTVTML